MKRRDFVKASIGFSTTLLISRKVSETIAGVLAVNDESNKFSAYKPGETISPDAFVIAQDLNQHLVLSLCRNSGAVVNMLYIFGGGAIDNKDKLGGIWCSDSFEDLQIVRYINTKYEVEPVKIIPVACAPVYSSQYYGLEKSVFLDEPDSSDKYKDAVQKFIKSTNESVEAGYIPIQPYFDLRLRLLFNRDEDLKPGEGYGEIYPWQGKFRADEETQKYGVPTIWFLNSEGVVLEPPLRGNFYNSDPYEINYTIVDVDKILGKYL